MGVIIALLVLNCNLHLNQQACLETHVKCIETMAATPLNNSSMRCLSRDKRVAAAYLYCVESSGNIHSSIDYATLVEDLYGVNSISNNPYAGFNVWEKPGYMENMANQISLLKFRCE